MARLTKISTSQRYNWLGRGRLSISTALSDIQGPRGAKSFTAARLHASRQGRKTISEAEGRRRTGLAAADGLSFQETGRTRAGAGSRSVDRIEDGREERSASNNAPSRFRWPLQSARRLGPSHLIHGKPPRLFCVCGSHRTDRLPRPAAKNRRGFYARRSKILWPDMEPGFIFPAPHRARWPEW